MSKELTGREIEERRHMKKKRFVWIWNRGFLVQQWIG